MINNFIVALQFLTIFTVKRNHEVNEGDLARSIAWFPVVGFLLGVVLVYSDKALLWILPHTNTLSNALLLVISVVTTRALHMDGLADTLDGLMGGKDRESRLRIMKDSRLGTAGALGIVFALLLKYLCLNSLFGGSRTEALLIAPIFGRWSQAMMVFRSNYGRESGMGRAFVGHLRLSGLLAASAVAVGISAFVDELWTFTLVPTVVLFTLAARLYFVRRLGGITGDAIGAVSEINEVLTFILFVVLSNGR